MPHHQNPDPLVKSNNVCLVCFSFSILNLTVTYSNGFVYFIQMKKIFSKKKITHNDEDSSEVDVDNSSVNSATEHPVEVIAGESNSSVQSHCELDSVSQHTSVAIPNGASGGEEYLHTIIIDCSALSFVDSVGAEALQQVRTYVVVAVNFYVLLQDIMTPVC